MKLAPIALFVYNRPIHTKTVVEALKSNKLASESDIFIFSDQPKSTNDVQGVKEVRDYLITITGFKSVKIIKRSENFGLAKSILSGVTQLVSNFGKVIVLEDDHVTSPFFLKFMNEALDKYEQEERVISISGYIYPVKRPLPKTFFLVGADCWGWGTWKRGWDLLETNGRLLLEKIQDQSLERKFDFNGTYPYVKMLQDQIEGRNNSWAILWYASAFLTQKLTLYPGRSFIRNIGSDGTGVHSGVTSDFDVELATEPTVIEDIPICESTDAFRAIAEFHRRRRTNVLKRFLRKILMSKA